MSHELEIRQILRDHLRDPTSSFSIGSLGAIAEFHRDANEPLVLDDSEEFMIATDGGALRIELCDGVMPLAYETLSGRPGRWQHGVVFCLPKNKAASHARSTLTELGPDRGAIRAEDRDAILFDMGLGARNVDFCIRTAHAELLSFLRQNTGRSVLATSNHTMRSIVEASPHRIAISRLGRAEVYQPIGKVMTPEGPHTHVLPKLLRTDRTHSANIPVPQDYLPVLSLYPANPLFDGLGQDRPFESVAFSNFEKLLGLWGSPEYCREKARARNAMSSGKDPDSYHPLQTRLGRTALRVALRQARHIDRDNPALIIWSQVFDVAVRRLHSS